MNAYFPFISRSAAMRGEKLLRENDISTKTIPTPKGLGEPCELCLVSPRNHAETARCRLQDAGLTQRTRGVFVQGKDNWERID